MASASDTTAVRVAVRIRPLLGHEKVQDCGECIRRENPTQIILGQQRMFTYDFCFGQEAAQAEMYGQCVDPLLQSFLQGFNSTVMAYGQTGSGKSHTMGTENTGLSRPDEEKGIVPRVIHALYSYINEHSSPSLEFKVRCTFLEIHNEELRDLLDPSNRSKTISIRETANGQVVAFGIEEREVNSAEELLSCLEDGSVHRSTGSTLMNAHSSRSHAIFTVLLTQRRPVSGTGLDTEGDEEQSEYITSKFTFVDLAGSERLKKTGAEGNRRREGININCGLLALGNVISALGDPARKASHVPFRDSKITRLLQDSLGGNSKTLMVACVSPADVHFEETLNTLRYASRARNIVNKPIIGRDPNSQKLELYRQRIQHLESALAKLGVDPNRISALDEVAVAKENSSQTEAANEELRNEMMDLRKENSFLDAEVLRLMAVVKNDRRTIKEVNEKCCAALAQRDSAQALVKNLIEQAHSNGPLEANIIEKECEELLRAEPQTVETLEMDLDAAAESESGTSSDNDVSLHADSDIEDEVDDLEGLKKRRERQFRHATEQNARALKRLDADIDHKNALIEQLIRSKQQAELTKQRYEQKIIEMEARVKETHEERNTALSKISSSTDSREQIEKVKAEYQDKILSMTAQLEEMKRKYKENERVLRSRPNNENRIAALQDDIAKIKRQRVALQRQMKEEAEKHRLWVQEHQRQVAALQKQLRKDSVQIGRMNSKLHQQDLVMKAKTERATILQRELTEARRRMVFAKSKLKIRHHTPVSNNIKDSIKRLINSKVQTRELFSQKWRWEAQKASLKEKLDELTAELSSGDPESNADLHESIDTVKTELAFIESKISEVEAQQLKNSGVGNSRASSVLPDHVGQELFTRIGVAEDDVSALQSLSIYLINNAIDQRQSRIRSKRREKELEDEILQIQAESETTAARLDLEQRESNRRMILAERERERERQALLDIEFDDNSIRKLESQLSRVKRQQSQLLSPIPEYGSRKSRRRAIGTSSSTPPPDENNAPTVPSSARRIRNKSKIGFVKTISYDVVLSPNSVLAPRASRTMASNVSEDGERTVLDRLTDKSRFTGTSRYSTRLKNVEAQNEPSDNLFKPKQQLPRSPVRLERREFPDLNLSVMMTNKDKSRSESKLS